MYKVYFDGEIAYFPGSKEHELISPRVSLEVNKSGSFTFKINPDNPAYESIKEMVTEVRVTKNDADIFRGRVVDIVTDFDNVKHVTCEGELAYLLDSIQSPSEYHGITVRGFLGQLVANHNSQVANAPGIDKTFTVGQVTVTDLNDSLYRYTNWETTLDDIKDKLIDRLGGYLKIRVENGKRYLDYIEDFPHVTEQTIDFGYNLLDYSKTLDATDIATAVIPLGARLEESPIEALDAYLTVESVNDGKAYVYLPEAVNTYGWIFKTVNFEDVTVPENLLSKAEQYLTSYQYANLVLELNALDLSLLDTDIEELALGDYVFCRSKVHGLNERILISKRVYNLAEPEDDTVTLGTEVPSGIAERTAKPGTAFLAKLKERLPSSSSLLAEAKKNATEIMNAATHGYVVTTPNEQLIMDTNDVQTAGKLWRWNLNGLAYSKNGYAGPYDLAITLDGSIVADFINAGVLNADVIRAGLLTDLPGNNYWNLDTGEFQLSWTGTKVGGDTLQTAITDIAEEAADEASGLSLETPMTWSGNNAVFTAKIYKSNEDVTDEFPASWFEWYLRTESGESRIATGKTCTVSKTSLGYGGTVTCIFTTYENSSAALTTQSNKALAAVNALTLTTYAQHEGDQPVTELDEKSSSAILTDDYLMGIDAAKVYRMTISEFAAALASKLYDARYVNVSGDTMTGNLTLSKASPVYGSKATNMSSTIDETVPSSNTLLGAYRVFDQNGYQCAYLEATKTTADQIYFSNIIRRKDASGAVTGHGFYQRINADKTKTVTFYDTASRDAWLAGLGLANSKVTTITSVITVNSTNATISSVEAVKNGRVASVRIVWTNKNDLSVPANGNITNITIGTLAAAYRPALVAHGHSHGDNAGAAWYNVTTAGSLTLGACEGTGTARTIAAGTSFTFFATYITAS